MTLSSLKKDTLGFYHNLLKYLQLLVYLYVRIFPVPLASVRCPTEWYLAPEIPLVNKRWFMARSWLGVLRCKQSSRFSLSDSQNFCSYVTASKAQIQRQKLITILLWKTFCPLPQALFAEHCDWSPSSDSLHKNKFYSGWTTLTETLLLGRLMNTFCWITCSPKALSLWCISSMY